MNEIILIMGLWLVYSFFGFILETCYVSILQKRFVYRGFLMGPLVPIYGFGALLVLFLLQPVSNNIFLVFIFGMIATSCLEYFGHYVMEKFFDLKLWDYSDHKFNLNGRICLLNSTMFAILCVLLEFLINVEVLSFLHSIPVDQFNRIVTVLMIVTVLDFAITVAGVLNIKSHIHIISKLKGSMPELTSISDELNHLKERFTFVRKRLFHAYPNMKSEKLKDVVGELRMYYSKKKMR